MPDDDYPRAVVREINGQLVLDDPDALAVIQAVEAHTAKQNCRLLFEANQDRVAHFSRRIDERGLTPQEYVIVLLNVDDVHGGALAEVLMPGHNWQEYRDRGEIPMARGLASREFLQKGLDLVDKKAADKLRAMPGKAVVVMHQGVAEVLEP